MAVRLNPQQDARSRAAIQTTQLVKRLQCFALGLPGDQGEVVELDANKLRAVEILLRKSLPDLSAITISGDADSPLRIEAIRRVIHDPKA